MLNRWPGLVFTALLALLLSNARAQAAQSEPDEGEQRVVDALWRFHEATISAAIASQKVDLERFQSAVRFFELSTGISYDEGSDVGKLPRPEIAAYQAKWQEWFRLNRRGLHFNSASCTVGPTAR